MNKNLSLLPLGFFAFFLAAPAGPRLHAVPFSRGDADDNGELQVTDAVHTLGYLFLGNPAKLSCADAADGNDSGELDIADPVYVLYFLFIGGSAPPAPFPACGEDETADDLACAEYHSCAPPPDREPPAFHGQACTEIACSSEIRLAIGAPLDLISVDSCNACTPIRTSDNLGLARFDLQLVDDAAVPEKIAFNLSIPLSPSARWVDLARDAALILDGPESGRVLYQVAYPPDELRLPDSLAPRSYLRRLIAADAAGNQSRYDRRVTVVAPEETIEVVKGGKERDPAPIADPAEIASLAASNTAFAIDLYQALRMSDGNLFFSPYSISLALAMTYAGARGETGRQMAAALRIALPQERLHPAMNALDLALAKKGENPGAGPGDSLKLTVANSLWGQRGYAFLPAFLDLLALNYGAAMRIVDFENDTEPSRLAVNGWVSDQTQGKIKDLLPPGSITALTRLVLTNAIYFKASWRFPFSDRLTQEAPFHPLDGGQATVPMMSLDSEFGHARGEGFQALELLYHGEKFSMVILLPDSGEFAAFESALEAGRLNAILGSLQPVRLQLRFPRFSFEFNLPLKAILIRLGMADAFSDTAADFSGIDGSRRLFIHDVLHKAFIAVNEAGTEAAAATAVIIGVVSVPPEVTVDRPFLFLIRERESGAVLFLGRVVRP